MIINLQALKKNSLHFPVLIQEIISFLNIQPKPQVFLDCTFGAGGYSNYILQYPNTKVIAIDRDEAVIPWVKTLQNVYPHRLQFYLNTYSNYPEVLQRAKVDTVDGIIMDLGFSSMQINDKDRGFSFKSNGDLLMTMGLNKTTAYEFINSASQVLIADVIYYYGEERKAKQIAKQIVNTRKQSPITSTEQLADLIRKIVGFKHKIDPATKTFQAIRIYINDELQELQLALDNSIKYLTADGRLLVTSFHSLEDRIVKKFLNANGKFYKNNLVNEDNTSKKFTKNKLNLDKNNSNNNFEILTKKPITPTAKELSINSASASAKLRVARKL